MKHFWIVCLWMGFIVFCDATLAQENRRQVVILDPGHGGVDSGAIGINGIMEKDIVLEVAKEAIRLNKELFGNTLDIYLTRYKDTLISLGDRTKLVESLKPDIFISIHCNQADRVEARGIEVYMQQPNTIVGTEMQTISENLSEALLYEFDNALGFKIRGMKYANFQVLRETQYVCPGLLLEVGFLSNREEAEHSMKRSSVRGYAMVIVLTVLKTLVLAKK